MLCKSKSAPRDTDTRLLTNASTRLLKHMRQSTGGNATEEDTSHFKRRMKRKAEHILALEALVLAKRDEVNELPVPQATCKCPKVVNLICAAKTYRYLVALYIAGTW